MSIYKCPCGYSICKQYFTTASSDGRYSRKDALIVDAAPKLLSALENLMPFVEHHAKVSLAELDAARAAIAEAKGY